MNKIKSLYTRIETWWDFNFPPFKFQGLIFTLILVAIMTAVVIWGPK